MDRSSPPRPRALAACLALAVLTGCGGGQPAPPARSPVPASSAEGARGVVAAAVEEEALAVLRTWDRARAAAYASGSVDALRDLYTADSAAGRRDVGILQAYADRGLVVRGMRTQLLAVAVRSVTDDEIRLRVTDRLVGAVAASGTTSYRLPGDAPDDRLLHLRRVDGEWRMAGVRPGRP